MPDPTSCSAGQEAQIDAINECLFSKSMSSSLSALDGKDIVTGVEKKTCVFEDAHDHVE